MSKLNIKDKDKIIDMMTELDILKTFINMITDYIEFEEFDKGKDKTENILLTYFNLKTNQHNMLNMCYESIGKIDKITKQLKEF